MNTSSTAGKVSLKPLEGTKTSVQKKPDAVETEGLDRIGFYDEGQKPTSFDATTGSIDFNPEINLDTKVPDGVKSSLFNKDLWVPLPPVTDVVSETVDVVKSVVSEVSSATSNLLTEQIFFSTPTETPNKPNNSQTSEQQKNNPETEQPALYNPNKVIEDAIAAGPVQVAQQDLEKAIGIAERQITDSDPATLGLNSSLRRKNILDAYHGMIIYKSDSDRQEVLEKSQSENSLGGVQGTHRVGGQGIDSKRFNRINLANEVADSNATKAVG